jgi:hypothetical protein
MLELLKAVAPGVTRVLLLFNPDAAADGGSRLLRLLKEAAGPLRLDSIAGPVRAREEIERAVETTERRRCWKHPTTPSNASILGIVQPDGVRRRPLEAKGSI